MSRRIRRLVIGSVGLAAGLTGCEAGRHADAVMSSEPVHEMLLVIGVAVCAVLALVGVSTVRQAIRHARASAALRRAGQPGLLHGQPVHFVDGAGLAFVAGILAPATYCSHDLGARLDAEELRGVLLHERHHALTHAPLRLIFIGGIERVVGRVPLVAAALERFRGSIEIAADAAAIRGGVSRRALARAILELDAAPSRPPRDGLGFASAAELRLMALLERREVRSQAFEDAARAMATGFSLALGACAILAMLVPGS